jgi:hypothetical protein
MAPGPVIIAAHSGMQHGEQCTDCSRVRTVALLHEGGGRATRYPTSTTPSSITLHGAWHRICYRAREYAIRSDVLGPSLMTVLRSDHWDNNDDDGWIVSMRKLSCWRVVQAPVGGAVLEVDDIIDGPVDEEVHVPLETCVNPWQWRTEPRWVLDDA